MPAKPSRGVTICLTWNIGSLFLIGGIVSRSNTTPIEGITAPVYFPNARQTIVAVRFSSIRAKLLKYEAIIEG